MIGALNYGISIVNFKIYLNTNINTYKQTVDPSYQEHK
jgi:hypothetical protein